MKPLVSHSVPVLAVVGMLLLTGCNDKTVVMNWGPSENNNVKPVPNSQLMTVQHDVDDSATDLELDLEPSLEPEQATTEPARRRSLFGGGDDESDDSTTVLFRRHLISATQAIQSTNLPLARQHLSEMKRAARTYDEKRKTDSLERLITGSEAMINGNMKVATSEWSRIRDPYLNHEVQLKARRVMGVNVPAVPQ